jgi:hypothetical protein
MLKMPPMPETENEKYHIVSKEWFDNWKKYTFYDEVT